MPQIAQQDYLHLTIFSSGPLTANEKAQIKKHIAAGTIFDVLITVEEDGYSSRVLAVSENKVVISDGISSNVAISIAD